MKYNKAKQKKYDNAYLKMALEWAKLSHCERKQVGALIVRDRMIISDGYNGTPTGFDNCCEDENGTTHWYVLHAEANALTKLAKSNQNANNATLYITLSPCKECSKLILQAGISRVVYINGYKDTSGIDFLKNSGIEQFFKEVIISELYGKAKPHQDIFMHAFDRSGAVAKNSIMIGDDFEADIVGAQKAGMDSVYLADFSRLYSMQLYH